MSHLKGIFCIQHNALSDIIYRISPDAHSRTRCFWHAANKVLVPRRLTFALFCTLCERLLLRASHQDDAAPQS